MNQINLKLTPEVKALFQQVYDELKSSSEVSTLNEFIELLLERFINPPKKFVNSPEVSLELADARSKISQLRAELAEANERHQHQVSILSNEIRLLKASKTERVEVERIVEKPLNENQLVVEMPNYVRTLLFETVNRLSVRNNRKISPAGLLLIMFMRYTLERNTDWFYKFVFKSDDFMKLTGFTERQMKEMIKGL